MEINAAVATEATKPLAIQPLVLDAPKANEVLIKIVATGVCHTDAVARDGGTSPLPVALGHEGAGIVTKVGEGISDLQPGDHVVLSFSYCGECRNCKAGHPGMCEHFNELNFAGGNFDGSHRLHTAAGEAVSTFFGQSSFANYVVAHRNNVVKVDKDVDLRLLGPLGCGIQTGAGTVLNYLKPHPEDAIAIFGAGGVGLAAAMGAQVAGVKQIVVVDRNDNRLDLAKQVGATATINTKTQSIDDLLKLVPGGYSYTIDTTGYNPLLKKALEVLRPAGECVEVGIGGDFTLNLMGDLLLNSKKLSGVVEGDSQPQKFIPEMVQYYKEGRFPFDKLTKFFAFEDINQAFAASKDASVIKPIVVVDPEYK